MEIDVSFPREEPKLMKVGAHLDRKELDDYRSLIIEYQDVFKWSYLELKGVPPFIIQDTIPVKFDMIFVKQ